LSKEIHKTDKYLIRFLSNLLLNESNSLKNRELHVQFVESVNESSEKIEKGSEKGGQRKVVRKGGQKRWSEVLELIKGNATITRSELSEKLGINSSAIQKHIQKLKTEGIIERIGSDKTGYWKIIE
jgi:predicted HTH transcriptional regulator